MNTARFGRWIAVLGLSYVLLACGGGGGGTSIAPTDSSPGGLWQGTITAGGATQQLFGLIAEDGRFHFFQADDLVQYFGTLSVTGNQVTASFTGTPYEGTTFADASIKGTGTLSGTIQQRSQITINATFTTANNTVTNASATIRYSADYDVDSSLATISGNFTTAVPVGTPPGSDVLSITSAGVLTYDDTSVTGCMANGTVSIIDGRFDLYAIEFTYANCGGTLSVRNGVQFTGLTSIDRVSSPALMVIAVHGTVLGDPVALLLPYQST